LWDRTCSGEYVEDRLVACLHSQNRRSGIEEHCVVEKGGCSEVRGDSDILNNTSSPSHGRDIREDTTEVVLTLLRHDTVVL